MLQYITRRLLFMAITLWVVITATFFLLRVAPGGPFDGERAVSPAVEKNLLAAYDLDQPLLMQYQNYLWGLLNGDLGPSFRHKDFDVAELLLNGLPVSLLIGGMALSFAILAGVSLGITMARYHNTTLERGLLIGVTCCLALPPIVSGPLLVLIFAVALAWLPAGGLHSPMHFLLPTIALCIPFIASFARLSRGSSLEALQQPYTTTALAKGLSKGSLMIRHILMPSLIPVLSYCGPAAATLLAGSMVVEILFSIPGIGYYFTQGALDRDYTLVLGAVLIYTSTILALNFLVDLILLRIDPRIRLQKASR